MLPRYTRTHRQHWGGTTWTREDGVSLFTSMTESIMDDIKSQYRSQSEAIKSQSKAMVELMRTTQINQAAQLAQNIKTDARIKALLNALTLSLQTTPPNPATAQNDKPEHGNETQPPPDTHTQISTTSPPRAMDTEHDNNLHTDCVQQPMDTDVLDNTLGPPIHSNNNGDRNDAITIDRSPPRRRQQ